MTAPIAVYRWRACDACGRSDVAPDDVLCASCLANARRYRLTGPELEAAMRTDRASLDTIRASIATLETGGTVENLTLPNARRSEQALLLCLARKQRLLARLPRE